MEFGTLIPGIPLPEKSEKECGLSLLFSSEYLHVSEEEIRLLKTELNQNEEYLLVKKACMTDHQTRNNYIVIPSVLFETMEYFFTFIIVQS